MFDAKLNAIAQVRQPAAGCGLPIAIVHSFYLFFFVSLEKPEILQEASSRGLKRLFVLIIICFLMEKIY